MMSNIHKSKDKLRKYAVKFNVDAVGIAKVLHMKTLESCPE